VDELYDFMPRLVGVGEDRLWITSSTPQTTCVLAQEQVVWVPPIGPRERRRAALRVPHALALVSRFRPDLVVSTGAAMAAPYLVAARSMGVPTAYIESATRLDGPSLTGRAMAHVRGTMLHHQGFATEQPGWRAVGSVFDAYVPGPKMDRRVRRVVVILGTEKYPFSRALAMLQDALPPEVELLLQTGHTPAHHLGLPHRQWVPCDELLQAAAEADLVITHAGVGSVLSALRLGKHPIVVPRLAELGEHVDDHQLQLARMLEDRGLATVAARDSDLASLLGPAACGSTVRAVSRTITLGPDSARPRSEAATAGVI
jgi:UDP-N-acetylglucosamine transferase subunit ALG13